ncbi:MAG: site-specific integrase [Nitrosospira sp.]|nr:site-specific integrase [Nitrosospira sp.]
MIKPVGRKGIYWCSFYPVGGKRVRESLHTTDKKEAQQREAKLMLEAEAKATARREGGLTLKEAFTHAMRVRDSWRSAKCPQSIHNIYVMLVKHFGEDCYLSELDDETMLEYGEQLHDGGLTASTINKRFSVIAVLFEEAIRWKKYHGRKPNTIRYRVKNGRRRLISNQEELQAISLLQASGSPWENAMADLVATLADTGLRLSEALNLQPQHISEYAKAVLVVDTKTDEDRAVPLTDRAFRILTRRAQGNSKLFSPLTRNSACHIWDRVRTKMGLQDEKEFVLHAFRHTYGSTLANAGMDAFRIQKLMGHATILTTQRYVKVANSSLTEASSIMTARSAQKPTQSGVKRDVNLGRTLMKTVSYSNHNPLVPSSNLGFATNAIRELSSHASILTWAWRMAGTNISRVFPPRVNRFTALIP